MGGTFFQEVAQDPDGVQAASDIPLRQDVRERIVVDSLVILVGADHLVDMKKPVRAEGPSRCPEARRFQQDLGARLEKERVVAGGLPILPDAVGDVGADMLFHLAAKNADERAVGAKRPRRRGFASVGGRFPSVHRAPIAQQPGHGHLQRVDRAGGVALEEPLRRVVRVGIGQAVGVLFVGDFLPVVEVEGDFRKRCISDL